jgi:uncharacterized protein
MTGPLFMHEAFGVEASLIVAFFIGAGFGFALERAGFGSSRRLTDIFYGRDFAVMKVMFTAIVVAMVGIFYLERFGLLVRQDIWILPTFLWPQILGGLIFGAGFVMGGWCPGTAFVGLVSGKIDAAVFLVGILLGSLGWGFAFEHVKWFYASGSMGQVTLYEWIGLKPEVVVLLVVLLALGMFAGGNLIQRLVTRGAQWAGRAGLEMEGESYEA